MKPLDYIIIPYTNSLYYGALRQHTGRSIQYYPLDRWGLHKLKTDYKLIPPEQYTNGATNYINRVSRRSVFKTNYQDLITHISECEPRIYDISLEILDEFNDIINKIRGAGCR